MIAVARSWGIPTRYVSGYLHVTGAEGEQAPSTLTHAWAECRLPGLGWTGFDPTNRTLADHRHVRLAVGRDYQDVAPTPRRLPRPRPKPPQRNRPHPPAH